MAEAPGELADTRQVSVRCVQCHEALPLWLRVYKTATGFMVTPESDPVQCGTCGHPNRITAGGAAPEVPRGSHAPGEDRGTTADALAPVPEALLLDLERHGRGIIPRLVAEIRRLRAVKRDADRS